MTSNAMKRGGLFALRRQLDEQRKPHISTLVYGTRVHCPADRGDPAYDGTVRHIGTDVQTNIHGVKYVWVTVQSITGAQRGVWPSHRLGYSA